MKKPIKSNVVLQPYVREEHGIKETREALQAALAICQTVKSAKADDGVIDGKDTPKMLAVAMPLLAAIKGGEKIPTELSDLSDNEINELKEDFGGVINNKNFQKIYHGLLLMADGVHDEIQDRRTEATA